MVQGRYLRLAALALVAGLALAGCGRKGPLELPPGAPQTQTPAAETAQQVRVLGDNQDPGLIQSPNQVVQPSPALKAAAQAGTAQRPINAPPGPKPGKPFVLDPLL